MFRAYVLIIRRSKLHYTASGIITPVGGRLVHETATSRYNDARGCVMQFWPPDDEHICSKHVKAWNKLIVKQKFCASSWLITEINVRQMFAYPVYATGFNQAHFCYQIHTYVLPISLHLTYIIFKTFPYLQPDINTSNRIFYWIKSSNSFLRHSKYSPYG